jgi:hypothetical protein
MNRAWLMGAMLLGGCAGEGGGGDTDNTDDFKQGDIDQDGTVDVTGDPDEVITGDLSSGAKIDLDFAEDSAVACFPATENVNFNGNTVLFTGVSKEGSQNIVVQADPDNGVDISLYVLEFPPGGEQIPPDVTSSSRCEASYDQQNDSNPGDPEAVGPLIGFGDRTMVIGVAGANGATSGAFSVGIWRMDGGEVDTD